LLFPAGLTGFLIRLLLLLLARLLPTAALLLAGFSAVLLLLLRLIRHHVLLEVSIKDDAPLWPNVPAPTLPVATSCILFVEELGRSCSRGMKRTGWRE
jgi:hypothetical protein